MPRPTVAIISNALTPYRLHFHRRVVRELTGVDWWSIFTHDVSNAPWQIAEATEIRPVKFGPGESSDSQDHIGKGWHEYRKGGHIIRWLVDHQVSAVVLLGYNDAGRVRIIRWCHRHGMPLFLAGDSNIRGDRTVGMKRQIKQFLVPRLVRKCTGILPCGSLGREYFLKYGAQPDRIWYMPYEPDYDMIASITNAQVEAAYREFGLPRDRHYLLYCGRLVRVKRVDLLLSAFANIAGERPNWDVLVVGDGPLRAALTEQLSTNLRKRVHWLGFQNDPATVASLQRGADVCVLPSDYEPWGVIINEAAASGLALVVSDMVGAAAELVRDGVNGRVFPSGNCDELTSALRDVTNQVRLKSYQENAATVLTHWRQIGDPVSGLAAALASSGITRG